MLITLTCILVLVIRIKLVKIKCLPGLPVSKVVASLQTPVPEQSFA